MWCMMDTNNADQTVTVESPAVTVESPAVTVESLAVTVESLADPPQPPVPTDPVVTPGYDCDPPQPPPAE